jgi:hypothetical protein
MDFHALVAKLNQLDQSTTETCGAPMPSTMPPPPPEPPAPSMSVNLNAQGMDNIEQMMKLFQKVNPDMMPKVDPMPSMAPPPSIMSIRPELPPLKMLPDMDADNDEMPGGEKDAIMKMDLDKNDHPEPDGDEIEVKGLDRDDDGDHDMDDHDMEPQDDQEKKKDEWVNEPDPEEKDIDYMVNKLAGGMNKGHSTFPKVSDGDNPMQRVKSMEGEDLKAQIRDELRKRLAEAKGAK